mgnify:CR=1
VALDVLPKRVRETHGTKNKKIKHETYSVDIPYEAENAVAPAAAVYPKTRPIISLSLFVTIYISEHTKQKKNLSNEDRCL